MNRLRLLAALLAILLLSGCSNTETREHALLPSPEGAAQERSGEESGPDDSVSQGAVPVDPQGQPLPLPGQYVDGEEPAELWTAEPLTFSYGRGFLSPPAQQLYDQLCEMADSVELGSSVPVPQEVDEEETRRLVRYLWDDNPLHYWVVPILTTTRPSGERTIHLELADGLSETTVRNQLEAVELAGAQFLRGLSGSALEIATELHDRLVLAIEYDLDAPNANSIYGALVERSAVCDGYAKAYQYLLGRLGIPCLYLVGYAEGDQPHSWNALLLDEEWFYADLTWDDAGYLRHDYLLLSYEEIARDHAWSTDQYPALPSLSATVSRSYYSWKGYVVSPAAGDLTGQIAGIYARQLALEPQITGEGSAYLECRVAGTQQEYQASRDAYVENLFAIIDAMEPLLGDLGSEWYPQRQAQITYSFNDAMQVLTLHLPVTG